MTGSTGNLRREPKTRFAVREKLFKRRGSPLNGYRANAGHIVWKILATRAHVDVIDVTNQFRDAPGSPFLSPEKIARRLALPVGDLAESAQVHPNILSARPQAAKVQELLSAIVRVISAATEAFGNGDTAIAWMMNEPVAAFRHKTAFELVTDGRDEAVVNYLRSICSGFVG